MKTLQEQFDQIAVQVYDDVKRTTGYRANRYLPKVRKEGGLKAAKSWLKQKNRNHVPTGGFLKLVEFGRLDLSLEAQVIKEPWSTLFSESELQVATNRLARYGYFDNQTPIRRKDSGLPEELESTENYFEGARTSVAVNSFERNRRARDACVAHYGAKCFICGMTFRKVYGPMAEDFIHIHHLCSLSEIGKEYKVDPVADLRPVCPNCHAVLHLQNPPFKIEDVRRMMRKQAEEGHFQARRGKIARNDPNDLIATSMLS